jgi:hypothetical protein
MREDLYHEYILDTCNHCSSVYHSFSIVWLQRTREFNFKNIILDLYSMACSNGHIGNHKVMINFKIQREFKSKGSGLKWM